MKMKQSGVLWIGQVPKDWQIVRLKNVADIKTEIRHQWNN